MKILDSPENNVEVNIMEPASTNNSYEQISKDLEEGLAENKKCIDKVLEMRGKIRSLLVYFHLL